MKSNDGARPVSLRAGWGRPARVRPFLAVSLVLLGTACGGSAVVEGGIAGASTGGAPSSTSAGAAPVSGGSPDAVASSAGAPESGGAEQGTLLFLTGGGGVAASTNVVGIRGAVFAYADEVSVQSLVSNYDSPTDWCIKGTAARVDLACNPVPPATDCFGSTFGVVMAMNLNQRAEAQDPAAFDASALQGFSFELTGTRVPAFLRFQVESSAGDVYCNIPTKKLLTGPNSVLFSDLVEWCWKITTDPPNPSAETVQSSLVNIQWQVVTNTSSTVPFDFCVSNVHALLN